MAHSVRKRAWYPTDLTDAQWEMIRLLIPPARSGGRPRTADLREVVNGIRYWLRTDCSWRRLPRDFPPWGTVHYYYWRWRRDSLWQQITAILNESA